MNLQSKILAGVAAEWVTLGSVVSLEKGRQLNKELLSKEGLYPAYNGGISPSGFTNKFNYDENKIIISQGGASAGFVNFVKEKFYANAHCYIVLPMTDKVLNKYVYYFLKSNQEKLTKKQHGAGIPALRKNEILMMKIPIPPLSVQKEIVRILDAFTSLTAELTAERILREKQYTYYRDQLLTFNAGGGGGTIFLWVKWLKLNAAHQLLRKKYSPVKYRLLPVGVHLLIFIT